MNNNTEVKKRDNRASDITFRWMLNTFGPEWEEWQKLASEWMETQHTGVGPKQVALTRFFETYLYKQVPYAVDVKLFSIKAVFINAVKLVPHVGLSPAIAAIGDSDKNINSCTQANFSIFKYSFK